MVMTNVLEEGLDFGQALDALKERKCVKVPEWDGFWFLKHGRIKIMDIDGDMPNAEPWFEPYIFRTDWQIVEPLPDYRYK